jgi:tetratricopeptide (TPR) repeat protein/flagellar biosynthesis regulator FlaF
MPVTDFEQSVDRHFASAQELKAKGRLAEAAQEWIAVLRIDPRSKSAHLALADALLELKLFQPASVACRQALVVAPGDREISHKLAAALRAEGQLEAAREVLQALCDVNSRDSGSRFLLAGVLSDMGLEQEAARNLRKAISQQPRFPEALNNLALLERAASETRLAEFHLGEALAIRPDYAVAWNNLGNLCVELSRIEEAADCYSKAVAIDPEYAEAHTNRALISLLQGEFEQGWQEYEWRWKQPGAAVKTLLRPAWDGSAIAGRTILLRSEQGAGDTIQFIRYARLLRQQGAKVLLHCQESLRALLEGMPEVAKIFSGPVPAAEFDVHAPLMSLPRLFRTRVDSIPCSVAGETPYLRPLPDSTAPHNLASCSSFRVGLVWRGNPNHRNDRNRSVPLELLQDLVAIEGAQFFSLQFGPTEAEEQWLRAKTVVDLSPGLSSYADTARCLMDLDLLITVDTSVAHLAGALGRPVWTLLPACNDWRWLQDREDSPWYPSMRLFRQNELRNWRSMAERVASHLQKEIMKSADSQKVKMLPTKIYEDMQRETLEGRELEASVLLRGAQKLRQCARTWEKNPTAEFDDNLTDALQYNQRLWSFLQTDLSNPANALPGTLRLNLLRLGKFIDKRIFTLFAGGGTVEDLLSIARVNERIAEALQTAKATSHMCHEEAAISPAGFLDIAG